MLDVLRALPGQPRCHRHLGPLRCIRPSGHYNESSGCVFESENHGESHEDD